MKFSIKLSLIILFSLSLSRFIPHPPNFTSLIALSFYVPALFGLRYISVLLVSFFLTDLVIGFHSITFFTWGSVIVIGFISRFFLKNLSTRIIGSLVGAFLFYLITNFGVWTLGSYGYSLEGLISCYVLAIPFFTYSLISTLIFSSLIEAIFKFSQKYYKYSI